METFKRFKKLWGYLESDKTLKAGQDYYIHVESTYNADLFDSGKYIVVMTTNHFGGKNAYIAAGFLIAVFFNIFSMVYFTYLY